MKDLLCKYDSRQWSGDLFFYLTGIKFKIVAENKCWMHAVEYNRSIFDELELELIAKVKVKTCGNLKTPIWYFDDGRSSRPDVFCKKDVLRDFTKSTGKHLCQSLFFNKVAGLRPATLLKKRLWYRCFLVNFVKFLRTLFFSEHLRWLLLWWLQRWFSKFVSEVINSKLFTYFHL